MKYALLILLLTACTTPQTFDLSEVEGKIFRFEVKLVDSIPGNRSGLHIYNEAKDLHTIILIRDNYPDCYLHEALHIIHGNYHKGRDSLEYCYSR